MVGLAADVLVRHITQDDPKQSPKTGKPIDGLDDTNRGFMSLVSIIEIVRMLSSCCDLNREQVAQALDVMLRTKQFAVEQADRVWRALRVFASSEADFADCLIEHSAAHIGCKKTMAFGAGVGAGAAKHARTTPIA